MSPKAQIESFKYAITKTSVEEKGEIEDIIIKRGDRISSVEMFINNKEFSIYEHEEYYEYIRNELQKGDSVSIEYIPYSNSITKINKEY